MHYAFVFTEAWQFFRNANIVQYVEGADVVEQCIELCDEQNFRRRVVYCFITGNFAVDELESFVAVLAASAGAAPSASAYFCNYNVSVEVQS